jgi:hypothetical protein
MLKPLVAILVAAATAGCAPARIASQPLPADIPKAKVVFYRAHAFQYSAVPVVVGSNRIDMAKVYDKERATFFLPAGNHSIFVRTTQGDRPNILTVNLTPDEELCVITKAKPGNYVKMLLPISSLFTSAFTIETAPCSAAEFASPA